MIGMFVTSFNKNIWNSNIEVAFRPITKTRLYLWSFVVRIEISKENTGHVGT